MLLVIVVMVASVLLFCVLLLLHCAAMCDCFLNIVCSIIDTLCVVACVCVREGVFVDACRCMQAHFNYNNGMHVVCVLHGWVQPCVCHVRRVCGCCTTVCCFAFVCVCMKCASCVRGNLCDVFLRVYGRVLHYCPFDNHDE